MTLPQAPSVTRLSDPMDLTDFGAPQAYKGWLIICHQDVDVSVFDDAAAMADNTLPMAARKTAMENWIMAIVAEWNFVTTENRPVLDASGQPTGQFLQVVKSLPQPSDGGARYCRQELLPAITQAFAKAIQTNPNS